MSPVSTLVLNILTLKESAFLCEIFIWVATQKVTLMSLASQDVPITSLAISVQTTAVSQGERGGGC